MTPDELAALCRRARRGIRDALDLMVIQSERVPRCDDPRATLAPLTLLCAVGAWEGLCVDVAATTSYGPAPYGAAPRLLSSRTIGVPPVRVVTTSKTALALHAATSGRLPAGFVITRFGGTRNGRLIAPARLRGHDYTAKRTHESPAYDELATTVDAMVDTRNAVAHRIIAAATSSPQPTNATISPATAQGATAVMIQLVDQVLRALTEAHDISPARARRLWLPHHWVTDSGGGEPPRALAPGVLWGVDLTG